MRQKESVRPPQKHAKLTLRAYTTEGVQILYGNTQGDSIGEVRVWNVVGSAREEIL